MKNTSRKLTIKDYCNHLGSLHSSAKSVTTKGKLPLSVFGYTYPYLVTLDTLKPIYLCNLNKKHSLFKILQRKSLQKNSYTSSAFSYTIAYTRCFVVVKTILSLKLLINFLIKIIVKQRIIL